MSIREIKQRLGLITGAFAVGAVILVAVLAVIEIEEPDSPDLADGAALAAAVFGVIGLLTALRWWSTTGERRVSPDRFQIGFIVRVAIAEVGLLLGVLGFVITGSMLGALIGGGLFLASLAMMALSLRRV